MQAKIKVFVIDDHTLFCESLKVLLEETGLFEIVGFELSGKSSLFALESQEREIDIVLLDFYLPDIYGTDLLRPIFSVRPQCHVVLLTADSDPTISQRSYAAGASAVLTKAAPKEKLIHTLVRLAGKKPARPLPPPEKKTKSTFQVNARLQVGYFTRREFEIIRLISKGKTSREIAQHLFISFKTVENHRNNILQKSGAKNMIELINYMIKMKYC